MKQKYYYPIFGTITILSIIFISGCVQENSVPSTMEYIGTKYVNCHINPSYPGQIDRETVTLAGVAKEVQGTRTCPIGGVSINNKLLFNIETDDVSRSSHDNLYETIGKTIRVEGYSGGKKTVCGEEYDVFYITNIMGWRNICCDATLEDTGTISTPNVCFWFEK